MWILFAGVLMCYLVGFVLYCCYNSSQEARRHRTSGGDADNPSGSPSSAPMMRRGIVLTSANPSGTDDDDDGGGGRRTGGGGCPNLLNHSPRRRSSDYRRISPSSTPSSIRGLIPLTSCLYDEISDRNCDLPVNQPSPQPALLTAHREQQLRQIKLEINALSCRLGIGQIYRDPQHESRHVAVGPTMRTRHIFVQPVVGRRYCRQRDRSRGHELNTTIPFHQVGSRDTMMMMEEDGGSGGSVLWDEDEVLESSDRSFGEESSSLEMSFLSSSSTLPSCSVETTTAFHNGHSGGNPPPTPSPSPQLNHHHRPSDHSSSSLRHQQRQHFIYSERERRLQLIRMEIEDLTLQLSSLSGGVDQTGASENNHAGGCSVTSSELEGLVYDPSDSDVDETDALMNGYSISMSTHDLPSYDESVILEMDDESPPPSYAQCAHLYSSPPATNDFHP